jgi:hypothetical protein
MNGDIIKREDNLRRATSSLLENSLPLFLPVRNIHKTKAQKIFNKYGRLNIKTNFGIVEINGQILGQNHKDILETILCQDKFLVSQDNAIAVNFGRYKFLQSLGRSTGNYAWLEDRIREIRNFNFAIGYINKNKEQVIYGGFGIIDKYRFESDGTMSIKFTKEFSTFYRKENLLQYQEYVPLIAKIKEPFIKALVREMIKHKNYSIYFSTFIDNYNLKEIVGRNEIFEFKKKLKSIEYQEELYNNFNISIKLDTKDILISIERDNSKVCLLENNSKNYPIKFNNIFK